MTTGSDSLSDVQGSAGAGRSPRQVILALAPSVYGPTLLQFAGQAALMPVIALLALQLGFTQPQAAALTVVFGLAAFLGPIPAGRLISWIGARTALVTTGTLLVAASILAYAVLTPALAEGGGTASRLALIGMLVVMAGCSEVWMLGRQAYLGTALPARMRARGMTMFGGMIRIGQVIGPLGGAAVLAVGSLTGVFLLYAAMTLAATVMVALFLPAGERRSRHSAATATARQHRPRSPARIRLTRAVLARMLMVGLGIAPVMMARVNNPVVLPLLGKGLGLDAFWISLVFGVAAVVEILLVIPAGMLMDRFGRAAVAVPCAGLMGTGYLVLALTSSAGAGQGFTIGLLALLLPSLLIALGNGLGSGIVMTLGIDVSPVHGRTGYLSWWNTMMGAGRLSAPLLVAGIVLVAPMTAAAAVTGLLCLAGAVQLRRALPRVAPRGSARAA